jgi:amino acid adenylation domain-containing protein
VTIPRQTIPRGTGDETSLLSFAQERLFLLDRIMPGLPAYNVPRVLRIAAHVDADALEQAFASLVQRHEILRTTIDLVDGRPSQHVGEEAGFSLSVEDLRALPRDEREGRAQRIVSEHGWRPFDLSRDLLLRATLVRIDEEENWLLVVLHHLASDHASTAVLLPELSHLYDAAVAGVAPDLPELPIQYSDFARWQRERLDGEALAGEVDYWRTQLAGCPDLTDLPTDRPRPKAQSYRGARTELEWPPELVHGLRATAREHGVSLFMALVAGFDVVLQRYSRSDDVVIGTAVSGRHYEGLLPLIGFFSNTLPLRVDLGGDPTFADLLARVRTVVLMAQAHQDVPFEKLVEVVNPERNPAHAPIFQTLVTLNTEPLAGATLAGATLEQLDVLDWDWSRFDLSFILLERGEGGIGGFAEYASDLFDAGTVERMLGHVETVLAAAVADPSRPISELAMLTEPERAALETWNRTETPYPVARLDELFAEQAARTPEATAVVCDGRELTYRDLDERSTSLAEALRGLGVGRDSLVGICLDRTLELPVALLGVLKSGAAYVPVDPSYPPERRAFLLEDAAAPVLITQERLLAELEGAAPHVLCVDRELTRGGAAADAPVTGTAEDVAYVIYTSGSTGRPKGVEIRHRSVVNLMTHMRERPGIEAGETLVNLTTAAFDLSVPDFYLPLLNGGRLVIAPREATLDAGRLAQLLDDADVVQATPTTWQLLVDNDWPGRARLKIVCGGEPVSRELANELDARGQSSWHMYGPTETTVWSSIAELRAADGPVLIGGPIANTSFHVLDEHGHHVPVGVPGELHIGGAGVARGYRNRPDLTEEKFVPNAFEDGTHPRLYRTGDLVRWRPGGMLEFLGRIDQQIKLRGFRIELGEIESVLAAHPSVAACCAVVREDIPGDRRLVAYVVGSGDGPALDELRRLAREQLPPYMVPAAFVVLESLPVTPNRKLDRAALPPPDGARPAMETEYVAPRTPTEQLLAGIWERLLGVDRIGVHDDFFALGGHSLLAVQMLALVERECGCDLPLTVVFQNSTVRDLATEVAASLVAESAGDDLEALLAEVEASV